MSKKPVSISLTAMISQLWNPNDSRKFIETEFPWFITTYDTFKLPVQRVDTLRYFLMRHFGGIYIDLDNVSRLASPLQSSCGRGKHNDYGSLICSRRVMWIQGCAMNLDALLYYPVWVTDGGHGALSNNILGAQPNHPFWVSATNTIISYAWNYPLPYITVSYATGQWFETVI